MNSLAAPYVIFVDFRLRQGTLSRFRTLIDANARASVRDEPGCRRFDVVELIGEPDRVLLYEIYDDEAAFDDHCRTAHFLEFEAASASIVAARSVMRGALVCEASAAQ